MKTIKIDENKLPAKIQHEYKLKNSCEKRTSKKVFKVIFKFCKICLARLYESHHRHIADKFNQLASGEINRLIINMPPRHTKSEFASCLLPAWMVGLDPKLKIIQATHTAELAIRFGRKAKNVIDSKEYQELFKTKLQEDSKAAGRWETKKEAVFCSWCWWSNNRSWC